MRRALLLLVPVLLLAACGDDGDDAATDDPADTPTTLAVPGLDEPDEQRTCSAADLEEDVQDVRGDVPAPAWDLRAEIIDAALACDYDRLQELALEGDGQFSFSFGAGGPDEAGAHWRRLEESGDEKVLRLLVETLRLPHVVRDGVVTWPSAHQETPSDGDWDAVAPLYGEDEVRSWRGGGSGFLGYRIGITADGEWQYFIAGD